MGLPLAYHLGDFGKSMGTVFCSFMGPGGSNQLLRPFLGHPSLFLPPPLKSCRKRPPTCRVARCHGEVSGRPARQRGRHRCRPGLRHHSGRLTAIVSAISNVGRRSHRKCLMQLSTIWIPRRYATLTDLKLWVSEQRVQMPAHGKKSDHRIARSGWFP